MKIITKCGGRYKKDAKAQRLIESYGARAVKTMNLLSKKMGFNLPKQIIVRPLYPKSDLCFILGRAIWTPQNGFEIAMEIQSCSQMRDKGMAVVDHECAHIANAIKNNDWGHGHNFKKMNAMCRKGERKSVRKRTKSAIF